MRMTGCLAIALARIWDCHWSGRVLSWGTPVSYTHLDVYKRQNPTCVKRLSSSPNTSFISVPRKWWMQLVKSNSAFGSFGRLLTLNHHSQFLG